MRSKLDIKMIGIFGITLVPMVLFLLIITSIVKALIGCSLAIFSLYIFMQLIRRTDQQISTNQRNIISKSIQGISDSKSHLENMAIDLVNIMRKIFKKTSDGFDEAKAVVEFFIGAPTGGNNTVSTGTTTFGNSYMSQIIKKNEEVLIKSEGLFEEISRINHELLNQVEVTTQKIAEIDTFVAEINKISIQTRILALNAMIEAARAGEYAAGFSIVADEVKRMADRTDQMADHIKSVAGDSVNMMEKLRTEMKAKITESLEGLETIKKDYSDTFNILKTGIDHISEAIKVVTLNYQEIANDIKGVIVTLQYQDISTQKLDTVSSDLSSLIKVPPDIHRSQQMMSKDVPMKEDVTFF